MEAWSNVQPERIAAKARLIDVAERALRDALIEQERPLTGMYMHPSREADLAFAHAVREVCDNAHRLDMRAEEMLIAVKQAWSQLAPVRARHLGDRDGDVLRAVVSTSIEVFFEPIDQARTDKAT
jgi:hypothetical protein